MGSTRDLIHFSEALGDATAILTFIAERSSSRHRATLEQLRHEAALADQKAKRKPVPTLPAPPPKPDSDMDVMVTGFLWPPPQEDT